MEHDQGEIGEKLGTIVDRLAGMVEIITTFISNTVDMTTCSYHLIRSLVNKELFSSSWNAFQIAQNLFEIILMCWTADHLARSSVLI